MFHRFKPYIFLLFITIMAYWQIAFCTNAVKWDMLDCWLPWRYFIGECLQNNVFPFWNPYQALGYPLYADLSVPIWSPEVMVTSFFFDHSIYSLQILFVLYIFVAAAGMFRLIRYLTQNNYAALIISCAYILSGFFIAHVQHFILITSAAYMPWFFLYFIKILNKQLWQDSLKSAFFLFLMVTTGYATLTILAGYLCFFFTIFFVWYQIKNKKNIAFNKLLSSLFVFLLFSTVLCLPIIVSFIQVMPQIERFSQGVSDSTAVRGPLSPKSFLSFISPFSMVNDEKFFHTDIAMSNAYIGIITLVLLFTAILSGLSRIHKLVLGTSLIFLLVAAGDSFPLFKMSRHLPLLGVFRFPSLYSYFSTFFFFILVAFYLNKGFAQIKDNKKQIVTSTLLITLLLFCVLIIAFAKTDFGQFSYLKSYSSFGLWVNSGNVYENTFLYAIFQLVILGFFLLIVFKSTNFRFHLLLLVLTEMTVSVQGNIYKTAITENNVKSLSNQLRDQPKGFPKPNLSIKIKNYTDDNRKINGLWRNTNIFSKTISADCFSSFHLKDFDNLKDHFPNLLNASLNNPLIYLSGNIFSVNSLHDTLIDPNKNTKDVYLNDNDYKEIKESALGISNGDTVSIAAFTPNEILLNTETKKITLLTLLQSNYSSWKIFIDNKEVKKIVANTNFMSILLPPGSHKVKFMFDNKVVVFVSSVTYILVLILIIYFIVSYYKAQNDKRWKHLIITITVTSGLWMGFKIVNNKPYIGSENEYLFELETKTKTIVDSLKSNHTDANVLFNTDKTIKLNYKIMRFEENADLDALAKLVHESKSTHFIYTWLNVRDPLEVTEIIRSKYPKASTLFDKERRSIRLFSIDTNYTRPSLFYSCNDFNKQYTQWSHNPSVITSIKADFTELSVNANLLDSLNIYSSTYEYKIGAEVNKLKEKFMTISLDAIAEKEFTGVLVYAIDRDGKTYQYVTQNIVANGINKWTKNILQKKIPQEIQPGDIIKIYVWNTGKAKAYISNFKVVCYAD